MKRSNLKSLDWESILNNNSSNDEYDSDETICEGNLDVEVSVRKGFKNNHNLTNDEVGISNGKVLHCSTIVEKNLGEICTLKNSTSSSETNFNNCRVTPTSSLEFSDKILNFNETGKNITVNDRDGFTERIEVTSGENTSSLTSSVSTFGFTNMTLNYMKCIEDESHIKTESERKPITNDSSEKERSLSSEELNCIRGPSNTQSTTTVSGLSSTTHLKKELDEIPHENSTYFRDTAQLSIDKKQNCLEHFNEGALNLDSTNFGLSNILGIVESGKLKRVTHDSVTHSCNESREVNQQDTDNSSLQSENYYLGISTESLVNIIENDFIDHFDSPSVQKRSTCSPPLTLVEKVGIKNITAHKALPKKRMMKIKSQIPSKTLPARRCSSKYINQSKRCIESEELAEPSSASCNPEILETKGGRINNDTSHLKIQVEYSERNKSSKSEAIKGKIRRHYKKQKLLKNKTCTQNDDYVKVSLLQYLKKMEQALFDIEQKTLKWVSGEEDHCVSREKAFGMLMESQRIYKSLESYQVPMRCRRRKYIQVKSTLSDRAKKLALAIDAAISECDQEYNEKLFDSRSRSSGEASGENNVRIRKTVHNSMYNSCSSATEKTFNHHIYENSNENNSKTHQWQKVSMDDYQQKFDFPSVNINKFNTQNQRGNKPKPILKYSDSENLAGRCVSEGKRISFSDNVEFCYPSGINTNSLLDSEKTFKQTKESFNIDGINKRKHENKEVVEENFVYNTYSSFSKNTLQTETSNINDFPARKTGYQVDKNKSHERLLGNTLEIDEMFYEQYSAVESNSLEKSQTTGQRNPLDFQQLKTTKETQIEETNHHHTKVVEGIKNISQKCVENHLLTNSSNSEGSSEGFGFSEEKDNQATWRDTSIMDIKYIRIKQPTEFSTVKDDDWLKDLDKW